MRSKLDKELCRGILKAGKLAPPLPLNKLKERRGSEIEVRCRMIAAGS